MKRAISAIVLFMLILLIVFSAYAESDTEGINATTFIFRYTARMQQWNNDPGVDPILLTTDYGHTMAIDHVVISVDQDNLNIISGMFDLDAAWQNDKLRALDELQCYLAAFNTPLYSDGISQIEKGRYSDTYTTMASDAMSASSDAPLIIGSYDAYLTVFNNKSIVEIKLRK